MKNFFLLILLFLFSSAESLAQSNQSLNVDTFKIGNSASAFDPTIEFSGTNVKIRANKSTGFSEFSNDGSLWKKFGSGSGSGDGGSPINTNISFEDGVSTGWSNTGGTKTQGTYTNAPEGDTKYLSFVSTVAGEYFESIAVASSDFMVGGCLAKLDYYSTDASGTFKLQVYDGSSNLLKETILDPKDWQAGHATFPCPSIGTTVKMRVISTAAGTILADRTYLGKENRTFQVNQARYLGRITYPATALCNWVNTGGASTFTGFTADTDCATPTLIGSVIATGSKLPAIVIPNAQPGTYKFLASGGFGSNGTNGQPAFRFGDGVNNSQASYVWVNTLIGRTPNIAGEITLASSQANWTVQVHSGGAVAAVIENDSSAALEDFSISVFYYPNDSQTAVTSDQSSWMIDVNIGGANPSLGTSAVTSYNGIENGSLDLVLNTGSATAKIPCSSTNSPTGTTCSVGNESVGVVFTNPYSGYYDVCADFTHYASTGVANGSMYTTFQIVETAPSSQTIIQEGKGRTGSAHQIASSTAGIVTPFRSCGTFYFNSSSERAIRLAYEQSVSGAISNNLVYGDRDATNGQRDIHITVRPSTMNIARPVLNGEQVTRPNGTNTKTCTITFGGAGSTISSPTSMATTPLVETFDDCGMVSSVPSRTGVGDYSVSMTGWKPLQMLNCHGETTGGGFGALTNMPYTDSSGNLTMGIRSRSGAALAEANGAIIDCTGDRQ